MSILETFYILFENKGAKETEAAQDAATASAKKTAAQIEATGTAGELAAGKIVAENSRISESFDVIKEHAGEMASRLIEHALEVAAAFQALFAVERLVDNFFETAENSDQLGERAKSIGVQTEFLDAWGNAVKRVGGTAEGFGTSLENVNRQLTRIEITGKSRMLPFLQSLGLGVEDTKLSFEKLLPKLAGATEGKDKKETAGALRGIGFDEGTIRLLQRGRAGVDELIARQKQLGLTTAEDAETAEKFNIEWDDIKQLFHHITVELNTYFLPALESVLNVIEAITEFLSSHKNLVVGFFLALGAAVIYAADAFGVLDFVIAAATSPITLLVAGIAAIIAVFALAYDDIVNFGENNKSIIGELAKRWPIVGIIAHKILEAFHALRVGAVETFEALWYWIEKIPQGVEQWREIWTNLFSHLRGPPEIFGKAIEQLAEAVTWGFSNIGGVLRFFWNLLKSVFGLISDIIVDPIHSFQNFEKAIQKTLADLGTDFPILTKIMAAAFADMESIATAVIKIWNEVAGAVSSAVARIGGAVSAVKSFAGGVPGEISATVRHHLPTWLGGTPEPDPGLAAAQGALAGAQAPIGAQTSGSILAGASGATVSNVATTGPITIQAQSNDPQHIADAVHTALSDHVSTAINNMADGRAN